MTLLLLAALAANPTSPRCVVQQVHTPAGKIVHSAPLVRCPNQEARVLRRDGRKPG